MSCLAVALDRASPLGFFSYTDVLHGSPYDSSLGFLLISSLFIQPEASSRRVFHLRTIRFSHLRARF